MKLNSNNIAYDNGAIIVIYKCNQYSAYIWNFPICGTSKNICKDYKAANRYKYLYHKIKIDSILQTNAINGNNIDECHKENLTLKRDFKDNNVEKELYLTNFLSDLSLEDEKFKPFIKHLNQDSVKKYLFVVSQNSHYRKTRCNNVNTSNTDLQIKLIKLCSELNPK